MLRFSYYECLSSRKKDRNIMYRLTFIVSTIIVVLFDKEGDLKQ